MPLRYQRLGNGVFVGTDVIVGVCVVVGDEVVVRVGVELGGIRVGVFVFGNGEGVKVGVGVDERIYSCAYSIHSSGISSDFKSIKA